MYSTVGDLIYDLAEMAGVSLDLDKQDREALRVPVLVAMQPSWPLTARVKSVVCQDQIGDMDDETFDQNTVWIAIDQVDSWSGIHPYAPRDVWEPQ